MNKRHFLLAAGLGGWLLPAWSSEGLPAKFEPGRDAAADVALALSLANAQGKRVLVDVGGEWCPWCHVLDRFFARHADVRALRDDNYVWLKVNYSPQDKNERLLSRWPKVMGYPHLFVLDSSGSALRSQSSAELEAGSDYDKEKVLSFLARYAPGASAQRPRAA